MAKVRIQGPDYWRTVIVMPGDEIELKEGEWLENLTYFEGGPFTLINDEGLPIWHSPLPAPTFDRFPPLAMTRSFRMVPDGV